MPQSSYFQTIARRAKSDLSVLMPPRSPLSRAEVPLMPELPDELMPTQPSNPLKGPALSPVLSPQQQAPATPLQQVAALPPPSPTDSDNTPALSVPSRVGLPHEVKAAPVLSETSAVGSVVQPSPQQPSSLTPQPAISVTQPLPSQDSPAQLPDRSAPMSDLASTAPASEPRSYLQTAARMQTPSPTVSSVASAEAVAPEVPTAEIAAPKGSEPAVILQPPQNASMSRSADSGSHTIAFPSPSDRQPPRSPSNTVHIGTIDIHIAPPPTPPLQPATKAPKPVALSPLARGFTSGFGLRQG